MREIKFRAWDKKLGWCGAFSVHMTGLIRTGDTEPIWQTQEESGEILMQYTGLKDKNGKEIYEGDIIGVPFIDPMGGIESSYNPDTVFPVIFEHGEFSLKRFEFNQPLVQWLEKKKGEYICNFGNRMIITDKFYGEVIGNIYENPELLTER